MSITELQETLVYLCETTEVVEGQGHRVELQEQPAVAVFKYEDDYYAINDKCTHGNASLCEGDVDGCEVECPFHSGAFNFITGEATAAPCTIPIKTHSIRIIEDKLYLVP